MSSYLPRFTQYYRIPDPKVNGSDWDSKRHSHDINASGTSGRGRSGNARRTDGTGVEGGVEPRNHTIGRGCVGVQGFLLVGYGGWG